MHSKWLSYNYGYPGVLTEVEALLITQKLPTFRKKVLELLSSKLLAWGFKLETLEFKGHLRVKMQKIPSGLRLHVSRLRKFCLKPPKYVRNK